MNKSYKSPRVTTYSRSEIMEMLGPVKTQYVDGQCLECRGAQVSPRALLMGKVTRVTFSARTDGCPGVRRIQISIPGSEPFIFYEFDRSAGTSAGGWWSVNVDDFQFLGERGDYDVVIRLIGENGQQATPCSTRLTIE